MTSREALSVVVKSSDLFDDPADLIASPCSTPGTVAARRTEYALLEPRVSAPVAQFSVGVNTPGHPSSGPWHESAAVNAQSAFSLADKPLIACDEAHKQQADGDLGGVGWETIIVQGILSLPPDSIKDQLIVRTEKLDYAFPIYFKARYFGSCRFVGHGAVVSQRTRTRTSKQRSTGRSFECKHPDLKAESISLPFPEFAGLTLVAKIDDDRTSWNETEVAKRDAFDFRTRNRHGIAAWLRQCMYVCVLRAIA